MPMSQITPDFDWRAHALAKPWYVLTYRNQDAVNFVLGSFTRPGKVGFAVGWQGACLFADPADVVVSHLNTDFHPWEIWQAEPRRMLRMQPAAAMEGSEEPAYLWVRSFEVVARMPRGFEYGPHGAAVTRLIDHLGSLDPHPPLDDALTDPAYRAAFSELSTQLENTAIPDHARWLAQDIFKKRAMANPGLGADSRVRHRAFTNSYELHMGDLIAAVLTGLELPRPIADYWGLTASA